MRYDEACRVVDVLPRRNPCMQIVMIGRGTDMLRDLGLSIPAWTIPAASWLVVTRHAGEQGASIFGHADRDAALITALRNAGHYIPRRNGQPLTRKQRTTLYTWVCPEHNPNADSER